MPGASQSKAVSVPSQDRSQETLARLFADASHDLVAPLNQVSMLTGLLSRKIGDLSAAPDIRELFEHIGLSVQRMKDLGKGLKVLGNVLGEQAPFRLVEARGLVTAALLGCEKEILSGEIEVVCEPLPWIEADAAQMIYVFRQLVENAIAFRGADKPVIRIAALDRGGDWVFSVRDNGRGFDPQSAGQAFRIFRRLDPARHPGSGVGLTVCQLIVERHGGKIWAESEPGRGTTVFFALPKPASGGA